MSQSITAFFNLTVVYQTSKQHISIKTVRCSYTKMSHHDRAASTMGPPPAKAADANTIADHSSISTASSPALMDITSVSSTNSAPLVKPENASNKSCPTVPAAQHESPEERVARFLKFVKNSTPEEISAMARKCGLQGKCFIYCCFLLCSSDNSYRRRTNTL